MHTTTSEEFLLDEPAPESRRAARRAVDIRCDLITDRWDRPVPSRCADLSPHGMWLETSMRLDVCERVVVCFRLPQASPSAQPSELMLFARVKRVERDDHDVAQGSSGVALEFVGTTAHELTALDASLRGIPPVFPGRKRNLRLH